MTGIAGMLRKVEHCFCEYRKTNKTSGLKRVNGGKFLPIRSSLNISRGKLPPE